VRFAAIDIGTNAVRLLLARILDDDGKPFFRKEALVRIPLRLGEDVFTAGEISPDTTSRLVETISGFRHLIKAYPALDYMAVATSALREAQNGPDVARVVTARSGIEFVIIDGQKEAEIIYATHIEEKVNPAKNYLYVDVGGGSTEVSVIAKRKSVASKSFRVGAVRMLKGVVEEEAWREMKAWVRKKTAAYQPLAAIGTGGSINKVFSLSRIKEGAPITYKRIRKIYRELSSVSLMERIVKMGLRPDRADVIVPASEVYLSVMKWARADHMFVPRLGLPDGMVHLLYDRYQGGAAR
jgi:exopolyphosphatase/guanosine-5'-triphosphate,3'-diphosphate pyrophosphatase